MGRQVSWRASGRSLLLPTIGLCLLLAACGGSESNYTSHSTKGSGTIDINSAAKFSGNLIFVKNHNIFVLHGKDNSLTQLTFDGASLQPTLSPNDQTLLFVVRQPQNNYSDLATMPLAGGDTTMLTDNSMHEKSPGTKTDSHNHYQFWAANPVWSSDGQHIFYLSDFFKGGERTTPNYANQTCTGQSEGPNATWIEDMGLVELPTDTKPTPALDNPPKLLAWPYCFAGGDQNLSLRPGIGAPQLLFTSFRYVGDQNDLVAQLSLLILPASGPERLIQLSPEAPNAVPIEPSWSPDGKYITYIRRENGQDNLYVMPIDATVTGTASDESYILEGGGRTVYYTNITSYGASRQLAQGILGNPVWISSTQIVYMQYDGAQFNLFLATLKFSTPTSTPATSAPTITLDGTPTPLTNGGVDGDSTPVWYA